MGGVQGWEKSGGRGGIPKVVGSGRKGGYHATLHNISQSKNRKEAGANKHRTATGINGYGKREV